MYEPTTYANSSGLMIGRWIRKTEEAPCHSRTGAVVCVRAHHICEFILPFLKGVPSPKGEGEGFYVQLNTPLLRAVRASKASSSQYRLARPCGIFIRQNNLGKF